MKYVTAWVAISASAKYIAPRPVNWDELTSEEKAGHISDYGELEGGLCHYCNDRYETNGDPIPLAWELLQKEYEYVSDVQEQEDDKPESD